MSRGATIARGPVRLPTGRPALAPGAWQPAALVGAACLLLQIAVTGLMRHESVITGDGRFYERMAAHPAGPHNFPYAYRIGLPWLVHVLPFGHTAAFTIIAWLATAAAGAAMYALLRAFDIDPRLAAALVVGFVLAPPLLVVLLREGRSVDPLAVLVLTLGTLLIVRRARVGLAATLLVGVTVHETCLFLIPLAYAVWARRPLDRDALRDVALVAAAPIALYTTIRLAIPTAGRQFIPGYEGPFLQARLDVLKAAAWGQELRRMAIAYGPLWLCAPLALREMPFARRGLVLVVLCLASMTFAFDWGRIIFFAAPVFYVAAARFLDGRRRLAVAAVVALLAVDVGYAAYMQVHGVTHGLDVDPQVQRVPVY